MIFVGCRDQGRILCRRPLAAPGWRRRWAADLRLRRGPATRHRDRCWRIVRGINDIVPLCGKCNNGARQRHQMLWIEDKCREKEVDFTKDVIYMYYRDLVK